MNAEGGQIGSVSLGRLTTIINPVTVPTSAPTSHVALTYLVRGQQSLASIAARFHVSVADLRWSNPNLATDSAGNGQELLIPPVPGVVTVARHGDTVASLAAYYHSSVAAVMNFNYLTSNALLPGQQVIIPAGEGPSLATPTPQPTPPPAPTPAPAAPPAASNNFSGGAATAGGPPAGGYSASRFPYGYCTWYVATKRAIPWIGNAWQWYGNAQAMGYAVGQTPRAGAIMVTWESAYGHVAYVERVNSDGSWVVSEMNFIGWAVVDERTIHPGQVPLIGFIY